MARPSPQEQPATVESSLTAGARPGGVPLRRAFAQQGRRVSHVPGPLRALVRGHDGPAADLPLPHRAAASSPPQKAAPAARAERRRRLGLERLCADLLAVQVTGLVAESRGRRDDRRDLDLLQALRARRVVPGRLRLDHLPGPDEPLLWLADVACGVVAAARAGDPSHTALPGARLRVLDVTAR